jgi:hypothetical protein
VRLLMAIIGKARSQTEKHETMAAIIHPQLLH